MQSSAEVYKIFNALGDPNRFAIFQRICRGSVSVSDLAVSLDISLPAVGQHISILEDCQLAKSMKIGRVRTCTINPIGLNRAESWIQKHMKMWEARLDRLSDLLDEEERK